MECGSVHRSNAVERISANAAARCSAWRWKHEAPGSSAWAKEHLRVQGEHRLSTGSKRHSEVMEKKLQFNLEFCVCVSVCACGLSVCVCVCSQKAKHDVGDEHLKVVGSSIQNQFLDVIVTIGFEGLECETYNPNANFALIGDTSLRKRHRYPPSFRHQREIIRKLRGNFLSRTARWQQLSMSEGDVRAHCCVEFVFAVQA